MVGKNRLYKYFYEVYSKDTDRLYVVTYVFYKSRNNERNTRGYCI